VTIKKKYLVENKRASAQAITISINALDGSLMSITIRYFASIVVVWAVLVVATLLLWATVGGNVRPTVVFTLAPLTLAIYLAAAIEHRKRLLMIASPLTKAKLANVQDRQIEVPLTSELALRLLEESLRELPQMESVRPVPADLHVFANFRLVDQLGATGGKWSPRRLFEWLFVERNQMVAVVHPREHASSITLRCEPEGGVLNDVFRFDRGGNYITAEAIVRILSKKVSAIRSGEREATLATATQKELAEAKLGLLHAQVEPHFLYNTLGSAKYLIRSDPARAESMLDNLILYLRNSLPRMDESSSTLGDELARARAYLDIMQIRMGERLRFQINVPEHLTQSPFPTMMLQTLVENAIKHGLEPKPGGGSIWLIAKDEAGMLIVTVADDGLGMNNMHSGTGIGHSNIRERLKLLYNGKGELLLTTNFPSGLAATIRIPVTATPASSAEAL
jgi:signal transduction histidine kinase